MKNAAHDIDIHFDIHFKTELKCNAFSAGKYAIFLVLGMFMPFSVPLHSTHTHIHCTCTLTRNSHSISQSLFLSVLFSPVVFCLVQMESIVCGCVQMPRIQETKSKLFSLFLFVLQNTRSFHIHTNGSKMNSLPLSLCANNGFGEDE